MTRGHAILLAALLAAAVAWTAWLVTREVGGSLEGAGEIRRCRDLGDRAALDDTCLAFWRAARERFLKAPAR